MAFDYHYYVLLQIVPFHPYHLVSFLYDVNNTAWHLSHRPTLVVAVTQVQKVFAVLMLTGTIIKKVDGYMHGCMFCFFATNYDVILEDVPNNSIMHGSKK